VVQGVKMTVDGHVVTVKFSDAQETFSWDDICEGAELADDLWMIKAHVKGHVRADGVYVRPYERGDVSLPGAKHHPRKGDTGKPVLVQLPHHASAQSTWTSPDAVATFLPDGDTPLSLNKVALRSWKDHPTTAEGWDYVDGVMDDLVEPRFHVPPGKKASSGVIIEERDGRVWLTAPTNGFGGYDATFPKGGAEPELSLQANAIKEAYEETGLRVRIVGFLGDFDRTTSVARMYRAVRVGGTPADMGWEAQAVHLVPKGSLYEHLNGPADHPIAELIGAGPAPK
jgi:8-oxo-dGTP pyrophosphatase MutT (NUDIX family)